MAAFQELFLILFEKNRQSEGSETREVSGKGSVL